MNSDSVLSPQIPFTVSERSFSVVKLSLKQLTNATYWLHPLDYVPKFFLLASKSGITYQGTFVVTVKTCAIDVFTTIATANFATLKNKREKNIDHKQHTLVSLKSPVTFELMTLRGGQFCILRRLKYGLIIKVKLTSTDPCDVICRQLKSPKLCARIFQHLKG